MDQHRHLLIQVSATRTNTPTRMRVPKHQTLDVFFASEKLNHLSAVDFEVILRMTGVISQLKNTTIDSEKADSLLGCFLENQLPQPLVYLSIRR